MPDACTRAQSTSPRKTSINPINHPRRPSQSVVPRPTRRRARLALAPPLAARLVCACIDRTRPQSVLNRARSRGSDSTDQHEPPEPEPRLGGRGDVVLAPRGFVQASCGGGDPFDGRPRRSPTTLTRSRDSRERVGGARRCAVGTNPAPSSALLVCPKRVDSDGFQFERPARVQRAGVPAVSR